MKTEYETWREEEATRERSFEYALKQYRGAIAQISAALTNPDAYESLIRDHQRNLMTLFRREGVLRTAVPGS